MSQRTLLLISQLYRPDPAAVGQYLTDTAEEMVRRGWRVVVLTANRGYDNPADEYPARETLAGVEIRRLPFSSFGKRSIAWRLLGGVLFTIQASIRALIMRRIDVLFISTNPPTSPMAGVFLRLLRRVPVVYWVMDLNPDQYVALGHARQGALVVRAFDWMNRAILRAATYVVVLDRFMAARVNAKLDVSEKMRIIPPWSRDEHLRPIAHGESGFRKQFGLSEKFVVMYSGNHGPSNPLKTLLDAAYLLKDDPRFAFVFVGGGVGKKEVDLAAATNASILSLPYWPLEDLSNSLSAADVHAVTMGNEVVGIVHPSKIYGAFAVERPILLVGPRESHIGDILANHSVGWHTSHGDVHEVVTTLLSLVDGARNEVLVAGRQAKAAAENHFSLARLNGELCDLLESSVSEGALRS